jgi:hypothetical protein
MKDDELKPANADSSDIPLLEPQEADAISESK